MVCFFSRKKSRNDWRICVLVSMARRGVWLMEKGAQATWRRGKVKAAVGGRYPTELASSAEKPTSNGEDRADVRESSAAHWAVSSGIRCILRANSPCGSQVWD